MSHFQRDKQWIHQEACLNQQLGNPSALRHQPHGETKIDVTGMSTAGEWAKASLLL